MNNFRRRPWLFAFIPLAAIALFGGVVMLPWNAIIPGITGWALLTYWKAVGLLVLSKILFSGFPGRGCGHGGPPWARHGAHAAGLVGKACRKRNAHNGRTARNNGAGSGWP
jgi:hypothetical protein